MNAKSSRAYVLMAQGVPFPPMWPKIKLTIEGTQAVIETIVFFRILRNYGMVVGDVEKDLERILRYPIDEWDHSYNGDKREILIKGTINAAIDVDCIKMDFAEQTLSGDNPRREQPFYY